MPVSAEKAPVYTEGVSTHPAFQPSIHHKSIALAALEILVHIDKSEVPDDYVVMAICYRRQGEYRPRVLPGINKLSPAQFQAAFYKWPVLRVPSVIVPREYNFVLLTEAKGFDATVEWVEPLDFDQRLFASSTPQ